MASLVLVGLVAFSAATAAADPNLANVPAHRHFITLSSGEWIEVGPRVCDNPDLQKAFDQFHNNLHVSAGWGPAAPGLHDGDGVGIAPGPC